jgi:prostaglandin-endoperoxide synthase 2
MSTHDAALPSSAVPAESAAAAPPARDRSRDGFLNKVSFLVLTNFRWVWQFFQAIPPLEQLVNWGIVNLAVHYAPYRPNPLSTAAEYSSWTSLTDRKFFGRHLPPASGETRQPHEKAVAALFLRHGAGRASHKSTALFGYFAQWFTDGFMRSDLSSEDRSRMKNTSNHEIDLCNLYGLKPEETDILRTKAGGLLKHQRIGDEEFPPFLYDDHDQIKPEFENLPKLFAGKFKPRPGQQKYLFAMGTDRGNVTTGYAMINVLFLREHNRIARHLAATYPNWNDEQLFQTTRNIMIVLLLKIVVEDYVNHITPYHFKLRLVAGKRVNRAWFRPNWVALEFNLLYRWHALTPNMVSFGSVTVPVKDIQINNELLIRHGMAAAFAGASSQRAGDIGLLNTPDFLVARTEAPSIQTARQNQLATYNDYREWCDFPRATDVRQISSNPEIQAALRQLYPSVDDIEFYPGLFAEDLRPNSVLGPLMGRMVGIDALSQALTNPLLSEYLYCEKTFSKEGLRIIKETRSLNDVVQRNVKGATPVTFTHREFVRTRLWTLAPAIPLPEIAIPAIPVPIPSDRRAPVTPTTPTSTVNDAIVNGFTKMVEFEFKAAKDAGLPPVMRRGAHPKHHGVVRARFAVRDDVPRELRVGLFSRPGAYEAYVRFSNSGRNPDNEKDAHGMAIKVVSVGDGGLLPDERATRDFLLVDAPVFIARSPEDFAEFMALSAKKRAAATQAERDAIDDTIKAKFPNVEALRKLIPNPLTVPYWSQVPYSLGTLAVKYKCAPHVVDLTGPSGTPGPDYLRDAMREKLGGSSPVVFDFMIQERKGDADMPIDDPTVPWDESVSPPRKVATLTIDPQEFESDTQMAFAQNMQFNPWHTTADHRPLGRINEARRDIYLTMQKQRHDANQVTPQEPTGKNDF